MKTRFIVIIIVAAVLLIGTTVLATELNENEILLIEDESVLMNEDDTILTENEPTAEELESIMPITDDMLRTEIQPYGADVETRAGDERETNWNSITWIAVGIVSLVVIVGVVFAFKGKN